MGFYTVVLFTGVLGLGVYRAEGQGQGLGSLGFILFIGLWGLELTGPGI